MKKIIVNPEYLMAEYEDVIWDKKGGVISCVRYHNAHDAIHRINSIPTYLEVDDKEVTLANEANEWIIK